MRSHGLVSLSDLPKPRTVREMAAVALDLEMEAQRRLEAFAEEADALARPEVRSLLARLAAEQAGRCRRLLSDWAGDWGGEAERTLPESLMAQVFAEDDAAACDVYGLTPYGLLAFEVSVAQRRFALYSYLAAAAQDPAVHDLAEGCASNELALAAELRQERRRAYRAHRRNPVAEAYTSPAQVESLADLVAAALFIEKALVQYLTEALPAQAAVSSSLEATRRQVDELRSLERALGQPGAVLADDLTTPERMRPKSGSEDQTGAPPLPRLLAECERAFKFYDAVASAPANASLMLTAQALSRVALERIKRLIAVLPG